MCTHSATEEAVPPEDKAAQSEASTESTPASEEASTEPDTYGVPDEHRKGWFRFAKYHRLRVAIVAFEREWETGTFPGAREKHRPQIEALIRAVWQDLKDRHYDAGWAALQAAIRIRLLCADRATLEAWAVSLAKESQHKLTGWREGTASELLSFVSAREPSPVVKGEAVAGPPSETSSGKGAPDPRHLARARYVQLLIDGRAQNIYAKQRLIRSRASTLLVMLLLLLIAAGILLGWFGLPLASGSGWLGVVLVAIFGAMGASFSGIRSVFAASSKTVPEVILSGLFTCMRPAIGAAAALLVWLAQVGGVLRLSEGGGAGLLVLAFVAGFSDALVVRVVGSVDKKE